jgi:hypothetical protein
LAIEIQASSFAVAQPPAAKAPIIAIDKAKPGNSSNPNIKASCALINLLLLLAIDTLL